MAETQKARIHRLETELEKQKQIALAARKEADALYYKLLRLQDCGILL